MRNKSAIERKILYDRSCESKDNSDTVLGGGGGGRMGSEMLHPEIVLFRLMNVLNRGINRWIVT